MPASQRAVGRPAPWESGLLIVDKPGGMTSHDVVARVRRLAHTRRVGHAGTLDPMATGVLVIGIEKATRLLGHLMPTEKTYAATIRLGQSTSTDDAEGEALPARGGDPPLCSSGGATPPNPPEAPAARPMAQTAIVSGAQVTRAADVPRARLEEEIGKLSGEILQVPSSVSAIKVNGQRAYKLTRAGEAPELTARPVTIYEFRVTAVRRQGDFLDIDAVVRCSSGTYIRALARDLGIALGTGGHLTALRRTAVGPYTLAQARTLNELEVQNHHSKSPERPYSGTQWLTPDGPATLLPAPDRTVARPVPDPSLGATLSGAQAAAIEAGDGSQPASVTALGATAVPVIPLAEAAAAAFPSLDLTAEEARRLAQGARLPLPVGSLVTSNPAGEETPVAAFDPDGTLVALVVAEAGRLRSLAVFVDAAAQTGNANRD